MDMNLISTTNSYNIALIMISLLYAYLPTLHIFSNPSMSHFFGPLSHHYGKGVDTLIRNSITEIDKVTYIQPYSQARDLALTPRNITRPFAAASLYPFNPSCVLNQL